MEIKIPSKYKYKFILVKIRAEINDISNRKKNREAQLNQYWFFERIDNINKPLADAGWGGEKLPTAGAKEVIFLQIQQIWKGNKVMLHSALHKEMQQLRRNESIAQKP